jgi:glycosyltransferase involved in cell wall biosynthesis
MNTKPLVTIILPAYNAAPYIQEAVDSMLNQTFTNFELIIIDDCSTDNTAQLAQAYTTDKRVKVIINAQNLGLIGTLNYGFGIANTKYIARMDADDISEPTRLEKQVAYMESHPNVGIISCCFQNFVNDTRTVVYAEKNEDIKLNLLYKTNICHAAAIIRKTLVDQHTPFYNSDYAHAEDYELWARMSLYTDFYNIPEILYRVRVLSTSVSRVFNTIQQENTYRVIQYLFVRFGITLDDAALHLWLKTCYADFGMNAKEIGVVDALLVKLINANKQVNYVNQAALENRVVDMWFHICYNNIKNKEVQKIFSNSQLKKLLPAKNRLKFKIKGILA